MGNQLFIYAAARRLALKNSVPLKLDIISGFARDPQRKKYKLSHFNIKADIALKHDSYKSFFGRGQRYLTRKFYKIFPFEKRRYIKEEIRPFDERLLHLKVNGKVYLDGYWQSEEYFRDIESVIREDFKFVTKHTPENQELAEVISSCNAVSLHTRLIEYYPNMEVVDPDDSRSTRLAIDYYRRAINRIVDKVPNPHFFCFSDSHDWFKENLRNLGMDHPVTFVTHNKADEDYEDLWLMSLCKHHIIANSTFSWWGAWLSENPAKIVCMPKPAGIYDPPELS
ncbi:MAG: alpha-1,2-fucosyltransferase [Desulfobacteraceae bacterium]|nr:alpha-1,2-fucosyltransferase [Desulfobacteraceae bacterium]